MGQIDVRPIVVGLWGWRVRYAAGLAEMFPPVACRSNDRLRRKCSPRSAQPVYFGSKRHFECPHRPDVSDVANRVVVILQILQRGAVRFARGEQTDQAEGLGVVSVWCAGAVSILY